MLGYYVDNSGIYASDGRMFLNPKGNEVFEWFLADNPKDNKLFYDLDPCVASIIKMTMAEAQAKELHENERVYVGNYRITYYPRRFFAIDGQRIFTNFGSMTRYKSDTHYNPDDTQEDKLAKAKEAGDMATQAGDILESLGISKQKIISPVSGVVDKFIKPLALPTIDNTPEEVHEMYYDTIKGNLLESYVAGYFPDVYDSDLSSAYGSLLAKLLDFRRGKWVEGKSMPADAVYGVASGLLDVHASYHPFLVKISEDISYTPVGVRPDTLTKSQIDLLYKHKLGSFSIEKGWWWIPDPTKPKYEPLKGLITHLWNIRSQSEGLKKVILRTMMAGIWGRMTEIRKNKKTHEDEFGQLMNTVWASEVENSCKNIVFDTLLSNGIEPLNIAVDGCITTKPLPCYSEGLGNWRLSHRGECVIISSGIVGVEGKAGAEEFSLHLNWIKEQFREHPDWASYPMFKWSPITLGEALLNNKFDKLGELGLIDKTINIQPDPKRLWKSYAKNGGDLMKHQYYSISKDTIMVGVKL